jgi:hypothetical protein
MNVDASGAPVFPNARFFIHRDEWEFWISKPDLRALQVEDFAKRMLVATARQNLGAIREQVELVDGEQEIVPGIRALAAPPHAGSHGTCGVLKRQPVVVSRRYGAPPAPRGGA